MTAVCTAFFIAAYVAAFKVIETKVVAKIRLEIFLKEFVFFELLSNDNSEIIIEESSRLNNCFQKSFEAFFR